MLCFKKQERFYHVYKRKNFFGGITVISSWGTFDSKRGGSKSVFCDNQLEVKQLLQDIKQTRLKRGYIPY
jgi:hypothetical protein